MMQIQQVEATEAVKMEDSKMPIQKSQIDMMMRIQKEMRIALWERVKELEENKVRIEEENEKLRERIQQLEASNGAWADFKVVQETNKNLLALVEGQISEMEEELECPVCFEVSDTAPIFKCPEDHLMCRSCRPRLSVCPLCRAQLGHKYQRFRGAERLAERLQALRTELESATILLQEGVPEKRDLSQFLASLKTTLDLGWDFFAAIAKNNIRSLSGPQQVIELGRRQLLSILRMKREATSLQEDSVSYHIRVVSSFLSSQKTTLVQWIDGTLDFLVEHFYTESE